MKDKKLKSLNGHYLKYFLECGIDNKVIIVKSQS